MELYSSLLGIKFFKYARIQILKVLFKIPSSVVVARNARRILITKSIKNPRVNLGIH